jgi:hypothetical protein
MTTAAGIYSRHYFSTQSDFTTPKEPAGSDAVKLKTALTFSKTQNHELREDFHPTTRDVLEDTPLDITVSMSTTGYVLGGAAQGTAPDLTDAYKTAFTQESISATTVASDNTTSTIKLTDDYLDVGDIGKVDITDGSGNVIEKRYFAVTGKSSDVLTCFPPFENAPQVGDAVKAIVNYFLGLSNSSAITCHRSDNVVGEMGVGGKFHSFTWRFSRGQTGEVSMEGQCRDLIRSVHTTLDGPINDSVTTITVDHSGIEPGAILELDDGTNSELIQVGNLNTSNPKILENCTRDFDGGGAYAFLDGDAIGPYQPDETTTGSPIRGLYGGIWLDDEGMFVKADEASITIDERTLYHGYLGDEGKSAAVENPENREVRWELTCYLDQDSATKMRKSVANETLKCFCQAGQDDARGCAFYSPKVQFNAPEFPDGKGELIKVTLTSRAVMGASGEDSVVFAF